MGLCEGCRRRDQDVEGDLRPARFLVAYDYGAGKQRGIAVTGPITWSFVAIDWSRYSREELLTLYMGWYIHFVMINDPKGMAAQAAATSTSELAAALARQGYVGAEILDRLKIGDETYFAARVTREGRGVIAAGTVKSIKSYEPQSPQMLLPPLYWYLGSTFMAE